MFINIYVSVLSMSIPAMSLANGSESFHEKLIVSQPIEKFAVFYRTRRFVTVVITTWH